jgi:hypothetical protein
MKANGAVRAWRISTRMALKRDNFFKNPLGGLASSSKYYYRINRAGFATNSAEFQAAI